MSEMQDLIVVALPWGSGVYREVRSTERLTRDGTALVLLTDSPVSAVAVAVCGGHWAWHTVCLLMRGLPAFGGLEAGVTIAEQAGGGHLVSGPGGRMIVTRVDHRLTSQPAGQTLRLWRAACGVRWARPGAGIVRCLRRCTGDPRRHRWTR